ncbi:unnamed protein product, partial [Symbiodinium pilosum]
MFRCMECNQMCPVPRSVTCGVFHLSGPKQISKEHHSKVCGLLQTFKPRFALLEHGLEDDEDFHTEYLAAGYVVAPIPLSTCPNMLYGNSVSWKLLLPAESEKTQKDVQDVNHLVTPFLKTIEPGISFGGIACCDQHEYEANLSVSKIYDCTVTGDMFKPFFFTHRFPPSEGQVLRMAKHFETSSESESEILWPSPISLWARDKRTMPKPGEGTPLANDVVWLGFLKYFADQIEKKAAEEIKKCRQALRRVRVTFHFCESEDAANQLKWTIEQNVDNIASNQTLK